MKLRKKSAAACAIGLLAGFALVPFVLHGDFTRVAVGDLVPTMIIGATVLIGLRNALGSRGRTRWFWALITLAMSMWWFNLTMWGFYEVWQRASVPDPYFGDIILFLHIVPIMAAVWMVSPGRGDEEGTVQSMLNMGMLLVWWMVIYALLVLPDEYLITNLEVYSARWDLLYLLEGLVLIGMTGTAYMQAQGAWRKVYRHLLIASAIYSLASELINAAMHRHTYKTGEILDIPFLASTLSFLWVAIAGRWSLPQLEAEAVPRHKPASAGQKAGTAPLLARLALLSLPCLGYWALFMSDGPPSLRPVRFEVAIIGVAILMFFVFLKQHLLDRRLVQLLSESSRGYENLQRLQGKVIQQEKLASLGELVSLGAKELQYPLAAVLEASDALATSSHLRADQLLTARKIGAHARRTRDLVQDLLSFAQQVPGEKISLDLKPLVQRAVQMESFKLQNREIQIEVQSDETLPRVHGNGNQLLQAFLQVVENGVEALQTVGKGRLLISMRQDGGDVVIKFADDGPGLQNPERVFDPFYTTKPVGKGTGLGLSATYGVIQDHRGQITCHNRTEGGAVFEIRLPAIRAAVVSGVGSQR